MWLFYCFNFERNYDVLKSKCSCILLNKNINFNKNETESKMKNPTHGSRETNLVLQLIYESQIKSKTVELEPAKEKREHFLYRLFCRKIIFSTLVFYLSLHCIEYTFRKNILLHIKNITSCIFAACFQNSRTLSVSYVTFSQ